MPSKMNINLLPYEIQTEILNYLPEKELPNARLVCKEFNLLIQPKLFRHLSISLHHSPHRSILSSAPLDRFIRDFDRAGLPSAWFTRYLDIDKNYPENSHATTLGEGYNEDKADDLVDIISSLENLQGVNWVLGHQIHADVSQGIMDAIMSLDNLRELSIKIGSQPPLFSGLRGLTRLVVQSEACLPIAVDIAGQLQQVIKNSPNLRYLSVSFSQQKRPDVDLPPLDLFRLVPKGRILPLKHLTIRGCCYLALDTHFFDHIRGIQTLELDAMVQYRTKEDPPFLDLFPPSSTGILQDKGVRLFFGLYP